MVEKVRIELRGLRVWLHFDPPWWGSETGKRGGAVSFAKRSWLHVLGME